MDAYQPTAAMRAEAIEHRRIEAYRDGVADEREQWVPLANLLHSHFIQYAQGDGSVHLPMQAVLELSTQLRGALGDES